MLLKDRIKKYLEPSRGGSKGNLKDIINSPVMDGFVDIKGYKVSDDGSKKLIYHNRGDNVVTDWMRHAIMVLLTGSVFSKNGNEDKLNNSESSLSSSELLSFFNRENHSESQNLDGYLLNKEQYLWDQKKFNGHYSKSSIGENIYAMFPTKVLFGTGKEYSSWEELKTENATTNAAWFKEMTNKYGGDSFAKDNFDNNITNLNCNSYSATISSNIYSGDSGLIKTRTVDDPNKGNGDNITTSSTMNKNYGVIGAVKTPYFDISDKVKLNQAISSSGLLLKPAWEGIGRPCFIYFNSQKGDDNLIKESWDNENAEVYLNNDNSSTKYLNRITYSITMPAQGAANNAVGIYYPYNGFTLKQVGLFNDARLTNSCALSASDKNSYAYKNMQSGMMLAVKNITPFDKLADVEVNLTWTLTI